MSSVAGLNRSILVKETHDPRNKGKYKMHTYPDTTDTEMTWWPPFDLANLSSTIVQPVISAWGQRYFEPNAMEHSHWCRWLRWATWPLWWWWLQRICVHYMNDFPLGEKICAKQHQSELKYILRYPINLRSVSYAVFLSNYSYIKDSDQLSLELLDNGSLAETNGVMACINQTAKLVCNLLYLYSSWIQGNIFDDVTAPTMSTSSRDKKKPSSLSTAAYEHLFHAVVVPTTTYRGTHWAILDTTYESQLDPHVIIATPQGLYSISLQSIINERVSPYERYQRIRRTLISLVNKEITTTQLEETSSYCTWAHCTFGDASTQMEALQCVPPHIVDLMRSALAIVSMQYTTDLAIDGTEKNYANYSKLYSSSETTRHVWYEHPLNMVVLRDGYSSLILSFYLGLEGYVGAEVGTFLNRPILEDNVDCGLISLTSLSSPPKTSSTEDNQFGSLLLLKCTRLISPSTHYGMGVINFERQVRNFLSKANECMHPSSLFSTVQSMWTSAILTRSYCIEHKASPDGCFWLALAGALHQWVRTQIAELSSSSLSNQHSVQYHNSMMYMRHFSSLRTYRNGRLNRSCLVGPAIVRWCATGLDTKNDVLFRAALAEYSSIMKRDRTFLNWDWLCTMIYARLEDYSDELQRSTKPGIFTWLAHQWLKCKRFFYLLHAGDIMLMPDVITSHIRECPGVFMIGRPGVTINWLEFAGIHYQMFDDVCRIIISPGRYWMPIPSSSLATPVLTPFYEILEQWLHLVRSILDENYPISIIEA